MDKAFPQQGSETQQRRGLLADLQILGRLENWLARLVQMVQLTEEEQYNAGIHVRQLTEEQQKDAGVYVGAERDE
jgi:hypothetical protein